MLITEIDVEKYKLAVICKSNMLKLSKPLNAYLIGENSGKTTKSKSFRKCHLSLSAIKILTAKMYKKI